MQTDSKNASKNVKRNTESARVLALIPAYNEAPHIASVVAGALAYLPVLVVDDGSTDDTAARAKASGAAVLCQMPNQGKGSALRTGFRQAIYEGYDAVVTLDADSQHDPTEIPKFLRAYNTSRAHLIIGQRDFSQMPLIRRLANSLGQWSFSWALGQHIPDNQSGYRLVDCQLMEGMLASSERGFEFEVEMILTCVRRGLVLDWVPIRTIYAGERSHINNLEHTINFLRMLWQTRQYIRKTKRHLVTEKSLPDS
jgi:glycosyltransferase involved in cell wall biosynthesis